MSVHSCVAGDRRMCGWPLMSRRYPSNDSRTCRRSSTAALLCGLCTASSSGRCQYKRTVVGVNAVMIGRGASHGARVRAVIDLDSTLVVRRSAVSDDVESTSSDVLVLARASTMNLYVTPGSRSVTVVVLQSDGTV